MTNPSASKTGIQAFIEACLERPNSYFSPRIEGLYESWGFIPFGTHRDADALTRANYGVVIERLAKGHQGDYEVVHNSHWLVGWCNTIAVRLIKDGEPTDAAWAAHDWQEAMKRYPALDEDAYLAEEQKDFEKAWARWLARHFEQALAERLCRGDKELSDRMTNVVKGTLQPSQLLEVYHKTGADECGNACDGGYDWRAKYWEPSEDDLGRAVQVILEVASPPGLPHMRVARLQWRTTHGRTTTAMDLVLALEDVNQTKVGARHHIPPLFQQASSQLFR